MRLVGASIQLYHIANTLKAPTSISPDSKLNLGILDPLYDLTPPTSVTAVVTEVGLIPPSSISSIPLALGKTTL
jgi:translation initiation factor eIF-2B subunit delta